MKASAARTLWFRPAALPGTEILLSERDAHYWNYFHERYTVCSCTHAAADWRYRGRTHFVSDRSQMLIEPGETHVNVDVRKPADFRVLMIDPAVVAELAGEFGLSGAPHFRVAQVSDDRLFQAFSRFHAAVERQESTLEQQSRWVECVRLLLAHHAEKAPLAIRAINAHRAIGRAKAYLHDRFNEAVCLDELAAAAGLSRFHLLRTFARHVGTPPHAYQIRVRIERATRLLRAGMAPGNVALTVGFADQSHFTRHFRRITRTTPAQYARMTLESVSK